MLYFKSENALIFYVSDIKWKFLVIEITCNEEWKDEGSTGAFGN